MSSFAEFSVALECGGVCSLTEDGGWVSATGIRHNTLLDGTNKRVQEVAKTCLNTLNLLERVPVNADTIVGVRRASEVAEQILDQLINAPLLRNQLEERIVAAQYRITAEFGGWDPARSNALGTAEALIRLATNWKQHHPLIVDPILSRKQIGLLQETARYDRFSNLLLRNEELAHQFMKWTLEGECSPAVFIQYPEIRDRLIQGVVHGLLNVYGDHLLVVGQTVQGKELTLQVEGQPVSILNDRSEVTLRGDLTVTIGEILDALEKRKTDTRTIGFGQTGVMNWHAYEYGSYDAHSREYQRIDLDQENWWQQLPPFQTMTAGELEAHYNITPAPGEWVAVACASRENRNIDIKGHANIDVCIPNEDGKFDVFPFGKAAKQYPQGFLTTFSYLGRTHVDGTIHYPDPDKFRVDREHTHRAFRLSERQGRHLMDLIRHDHILCRENRLIFQALTDNCATWVWEKLNEAMDTEELENFFEVSIVTARHHGGLDPVLRTLYYLWPAALQRFFLRAMLWLTGATKKTTLSNNSKVSASDSERLWDRGLVDLPSASFV